METASSGLLTDGPWLKFAARSLALAPRNCSKISKNEKKIQKNLINTLDKIKNNYYIWYVKQNNPGWLKASPPAETKQEGSTRPIYWIYKDYEIANEYLVRSLATGYQVANNWGPDGERGNSTVEEGLGNRWSSWDAPKNLTLLFEPWVQTADWKFG